MPAPKPIRKVGPFRFDRQLADAYIGSVPNGQELCADGLHRRFNFPKGVPRIWFQVYERPGKERMKLEIWGAHCCRADGRRVPLFLGTANLLRRLLGKGRKVVYVELWYDEAAA